MQKVLSSVYCVIDLLLFQSRSQVGYPGNETREVVQCLVPPVASNILQSGNDQAVKVWDESNFPL